LVRDEHDFLGNSKQVELLSQVQLQVVSLDESLKSLEVIIVDGAVWLRFTHRSDLKEHAKCLKNLSNLC
jgi:hypothetical protein